MSKKGKKDKNNKNKQESKGSFTGRKILKLGFWSGLAAAIVSAPLVLYNHIVREPEYNPKVISVEEARDSTFRDRLKIRLSATDISKLEGVEKLLGNMANILT